MIKKSVTELQFVNSRSPLPTVEVDSQSMEDAGFSITRTVLEVLSRLAAEDASLRATLYLFGTVSVSFREPCWSEFLLVAGPEKVLSAVGASFERLPGVRSRFSDYVQSSQAARTFHVEDGRVWEKEDGSTWYSHSQQEAAVSEIVADEEEVEQEDFEEEEDWDAEDPEEQGADAVVVSSKKAARYRAARSDAKVSSIRLRIEEVFGLPAGSVALCGPDGRPLRGNAFIKTLRKRWED
ncbi:MULTISPECIES: hypothetical protein [Pseudomonas]|uniref:Uncharacterized protein n=1 Tax=Pseudomonas fluorescens TaxID=294 RepID=A0A5E6T9S1_PSEFL|nr:MULTISPECIES: hypothetical protein [Pseudomonas]VVM89252.1 hypothetical protein PS652_02696 [Pseudomonas fluorescens]